MYKPYFEIKYPEKKLRYFSDVDIKSETFHIACTQLQFISPTEQKKILNEWIENIHKLENAKQIYFHSRVNQKLFEAMCNLKNLESVYIKWSGNSIKSFVSLIKLKKLKYLYLGNCAVLDIEFIKNLKQLRALYLNEFNKVQDFTIINNLTDLEELGINGGYARSLKLESIEFIKNLSNLKELSLINTKIKDKSSLAVINNLKNLERLWLRQEYRSSEFLKLSSTIYYPK